MSTIQVSELTQSGNMLQAIFTIEPNQLLGVYSSPEYLLSGVVLFQAKSFYVKGPSLILIHIFSIKFTKIFETDQLMYAIKFSSEKFNKSVFFLCDNNNGDIWLQVDVSKNNLVEVDIKLSLDVSTNINGAFVSLHDDTKLTDFELCGDDGAVHVHKSILAGFSPFIQTLLNNSGEWNEVTSGSVKVPNTSQKTLQNLKDYIYLQKMPEEGAEKLMALASYFLMSDLEQRCTVKLLSSLTAENAGELLELAIQYKIKLLMLGILESVKRNIVKLEDMDRIFSIANKINK